MRVILRSKDLLNGGEGTPRCSLGGGKVPHVPDCDLSSTVMVLELAGNSWTWVKREELGAGPEQRGGA